MTRRVAIVQRRLAHYRVPFFEALRTRLAAARVGLDLLYGDPDPAESKRRDATALPWATLVRNRSWKIGSATACWQPVLGSVHASDLVIVEQASKLLVNYLLLGLRRFGGPKVAWWGHGINLDRAAASPLGETIKRRLVGRADWWFAYTEGTARIVESLGMPRDRVTVVQNATDTSAIRRWRAGLTETDLGRVRAEMGIGDGPVAVTLGSIYPTKRPEFLVAAADAIRERIDGFHLVVIGDGPDRPLLDAAAADRTWLHVLGARTGTEMVRFAALGSVMLNPGLVGLAVLDAFALGMPVVTCDLPYHSPEIEYLEHDRNGLVLPRECTPDEYGRAVVELLGDRNRLERMTAACSVAAGRFTIEAMVERFAEGVEAALASRRR